MILAVTAIALCTTMGIIVRPVRTPDYLWPILGAIACVAIGAIDLPEAVRAVAHGADVYAFLIGILAISALAASEHIFDLVAQRLLEVSGSSQRRLFFWLFALGAVVTIVFSNDATIVVATPAALAVLARIDVDRMPYLLACAFVSNAASFVLPISNPANLVLFGGTLPPALAWLARFGVPSLLAIAVTYATMLVLFRPLKRPIVRTDRATVTITNRVRGAIAAVSLYGIGIVASTAIGLNVGYASLAWATLCVGGFAVAHRDVLPTVIRRISWGIVALVAGLFAIVAALEETGALAEIARIATTMHGTRGVIETAGGVTLLVNALNNLPVGVALGSTLAHVQDARVVSAATIAVDLGPNLSVTGSLATLLWLSLLRDAGIKPSPLRFFFYGIAVTGVSLVAALVPLMF